MIQLSHLYMTTGKTIADVTLGQWIVVGLRGFFLEVVFFFLIAGVLMVWRVLCLSLSLADSI